MAQNAVKKPFDVASDDFQDNIQDRLEAKHVFQQDDLSLQSFLQKEETTKHEKEKLIEYVT